MAPYSRRHFLIVAGLSAPALRLLAQDPYAEDVILRAMKDELARSPQLRVAGGGGDDTPYFISYTLEDGDSFQVEAAFGALTSISRNRFRLPNIEVRVGSNDFDNTGHIYSGIYSGSRYDSQAFPLDDNYRAMRENLWLGTDHAYKAAVESIARKRAALTNAAAPGERLADFSPAERVQSLAKITRAKFDEAAWKDRVIRHSAIFEAYPEVLACGVEFHFNQDTSYYLNTEGAAIRYQDDGAWFSARAEGQAPDGMILRDALATPALALAQVAKETELEDSLKAMARNIQTLLRAPLGESFTGPALFEPAAAAQLLAQLLGDNLRISRKPVSDPNRPVNVVASEFEGRSGSRVLPDWIDVIDDPSQSSYLGKPLVGHYEFDYEGVKSQAVPVIQKGVLKNFLTTRQPVTKAAGSNGHARFPAGFGTRMAAVGNLFVKPSESTPLADLKARLIQMCKERDKPYGLLIRKLDFPFGGSRAEVQTLQSASANSGGSVRPVSPPILMYRVYPDGREELIRGMRFRGLSTRSLRDILAASTETAVFEYINNGVALARSGVGNYVALTSVISPGLLFDELGVDLLQNPLQKPALVPPPDRPMAR